MGFKLNKEEQKENDIELAVEKYINTLREKKYK